MGCGSAVAPPDAGDDSSMTDGQRSDSAVNDSNVSVDTGVATDASSAMDSASTDSSADSSAADSASVDSASADSAASDARTSDASSTDASSMDAADAATCSVGGDWSASASMFGMLAFRFRADGTWQGAGTTAQLGGSSAIELGNYAQGATLVLTNEPGMSGCAPGDRGEYRLSFDAACNQMTWTLVSDTCSSRGSALNGAMFRRAAAADSGVPSDSGSSFDGGSCRMVGDWTGAFAMPVGMMAYFRYTATTWSAALSLADFMAGRFIDIGNANESSTSIVLTNDASGVSGCTAADRGEYTIVYGAGCTTARWTLVSDTCMGRATALNGATFTRM